MPQHNDGTSPADRPIRVLIAGIAGASLGTEIAKALRLAGGYSIFGCDISPLAYGHYDRTFDQTTVIALDRYVQNLCSLCVDWKIDCVVPGSDGSTVLIGQQLSVLTSRGIKVALNAQNLIARMSDKGECFRTLTELGIRVPVTRVVLDRDELRDFPMPCIVKPATGTGGSVSVFYASDHREADLYCTHIRTSGKTPLAQEYLSETGGEFTVGTLSLANGICVGAIALKRSFSSKLSVLARGDNYLISSGYSQGLVEPFPDICRSAIDIARKLGSVGPLNIQGRLNQAGEFVPFEINPRFSASTYLRALAGFNEVDFFVRDLLNLKQRSALEIRPGWYLRSLTEAAFPTEMIKR